MVRCKTCSLYPLPLLPSKLLLRGLADFEKCEQDPEVITDVFDSYTKDDWLSHIWVGFEGALQIVSLDPDPRYEPLWRNSPLVEVLLDAAGRLSIGHIEVALNDLMGIPVPDGIPRTMEMPHYREEPEAYKAAIKDLAKRLADHGL